MKRYIRSTQDYSRLAYTKDGRTEYLPTWCADKSDEELEELKQMVINSKPRTYGTDASAIYINESKVRKDLRAEGFSRDEIDEIIAMIYNGMTIDSAIQRQLDRRE